MTASGNLLVHRGRRAACRALGIAIAVCLQALAVLGATQVRAEEIPVRKPGHWRLTTVSDSIGMRTFDTCLTAGDSVIAGIGDKACGRPDIKRMGEELFVTIVCTTDAGKETRSTVLTGDFTSWYRAMSKVTFDPPQGGLPHMGVTVDGTFVGASCDDLNASPGKPAR